MTDSPERPAQDVEFGCAYFGVRDPDHARADLAAMTAAGFAWVLLPFSQDDAAWEIPTFRLLVTMARELGLVPIISPWGGDDFGGEGVQTSMSTLDWIARARETGAPVLHVDEPKARGITIGQVLDAWGDDDAAWLTVEPHRAGVLDPATAGRVAVLGTDAYDGTVQDRVASTRAFAAATGRLDLAWVQAVRVPDGGEAAIGEAVLAMAELAPRVGIWAWKGSTGRGVLRSADPGAVQAAVDAAIRTVRRSPRRSHATG